MLRYLPRTSNTVKLQDIGASYFFHAIQVAMLSLAAGPIAFQKVAELIHTACLKRSIRGKVEKASSSELMPHGKHVLSRSELGG